MTMICRVRVDTQFYNDVADRLVQSDADLEDSG